MKKFLYLAVIRICLILVVAGMVATLGGAGDFQSFGAVWVGLGSVILAITLAFCIFAMVGIRADKVTVAGAEAVLKEVPYLERLGNAIGMVANLFIVGSLIYLGHVVLPLLWLVAFISTHVVCYCVKEAAKKVIKEHGKRERLESISAQPNKEQTWPRISADESTELN